jgi:hypothetical protein
MSTPPERNTVENNLTPILWNAPDKPFHLKPCNATHYLEDANVVAFNALPKNQQKRAIFCCNKCGGEVAWADSKSGKKYLCDVTKRTFKYSRGRLTGQNWYYNPSMWHSKSCKPTTDGSVHPTAQAHAERTTRLRMEAGK